jgi:hypothetical protein
MSVPKAAVHEDHGSVLWEHNVRSSREVLAMKPKAKSGGV